ncbi:Homoserine/homoserine lactone efflux protein [Fundidesulfovibrio magnetotacticus]|uniref:Homoserine/homoserine lactone efflux protein n=1 Tax=Fundidesulfovibrio magnetotacticus TaxID=2730080 RepID=A0A6V8LTM5_9BACT|nr:LysE family translocator [Fundidesulfovibrio magnetotacticus]GFK93931.1 Homoserine/homoserine lactone efflux protein [Fundidesulfovibrio magnetotacticus]
MPLDAWLAFVAASCVILVIPGPTVLLVAGFSLSRGAGRAWWSAFGVALGDATALGCSLLGLGAFLQASAGLFTALKLAGAAYLVWMGLGMLRRSGRARSGPVVPAGAAPAASRGGSPWRMALQAYVVTALNPKSILFFVAFVPQFITPGPQAGSQMLVVLATFPALAFVNALGFVLLADRARRAAASPAAGRAFQRLGGAALVGAGLWTAAREAS